MIQQKSRPRVKFPAFEARLPSLDAFINRLVNEYQSEHIKSWEDLEKEVNAYFTSERMDQMEAILPGWCKMASYAERVTLSHIMCVFLGLALLPEFQSMSSEEQQLAKWIVLFHDLAKELKNNERDMKHGFRSAVMTAHQLPHLGFDVTVEYESLITPWSKLTYFAIKNSAHYHEPIQDNDKLPAILSGVEAMFGQETPAALIVKCVLFHMSINVVHDWPVAAPLTEAEIERYIDCNLVSFLKVMMLADNEGWSIFYPVHRAQQRRETLEVFQKIEKLISH